MEISWEGNLEWLGEGQIFSCINGYKNSGFIFSFVGIIFPIIKGGLGLNMGVILC